MIARKIKNEFWIGLIKGNKAVVLITTLLGLDQVKRHVTLSPILNHNWTRVKSARISAAEDVKILQSGIAQDYFAEPD